MAAKKTANEDVFAFATVDPTKLTESYREFAEKGLVQSKEAYDKLKTAAEDATKTVEQTLESAQAGTVEISMKAIDAVRTNADNSLTHIEALLGVKSVAELVELQTGFMRKQAEAAVDQAKELHEAARKVADKVSKPGKDAYEKAAKNFQIG
ncbi:phasin [Hoeflea prorocentri]|uniref:Phasin n=1 Tax=Hoeflea prorocentri TaxID=1922333 RepID=A0A9X3UK60_9HYPH|nr:phasin [Hoeflea prorocentri]MCY6382343.1 phasin [Hoeflea prorocentri]MDA5400143.1 phasin [Hoeflea prorocentri]